MLLLLQGSMIFGVSRAISRKYSEIQGCDALIIDISNISHLGVSSALAIEESIKDMIKAGKNLYIITSGGQPIERMRNLGVLNCIPDRQILSDRKKALELAIHGDGSRAADKADCQAQLS